MSDEILLYTKLSKRIYGSSLVLFAFEVFMHKEIFQESYAKTVSDDFGNMCKEWALRNLFLANVFFLIYQWLIGWCTVDDFEILGFLESFQSYTIYWMQIAYIKSISLLLPDWKSKHVSIWTVLLTLYPFLMTTYFILFPSLPGFTLLKLVYFWQKSF